jgi:hypothetical protein
MCWTAMSFTYLDKGWKYEEDDLQEKSIKVKALGPNKER